MKHLSNVGPIIGYVWHYTMVFISYMLFRNIFTSNSYLWWPFKHWIQDHTFESMFVLAIIGYLCRTRCSRKHGIG